MNPATGREIAACWRPRAGSYNGSRAVIIFIRNPVNVRLSLFQCMEIEISKRALLFGSLATLASSCKCSQRARAIRIAASQPWKRLPTDDGAQYDKEITLDASALEPMITFGTNPGMGMPISGSIPDPSSIADPLERDSLAKALKYMDLKAGAPLAGHPVNVVFIGSCTNSRLSDLRSAASVLKGRKVNPNVRVMVVPGSQEIKAQAQAEGLDQIFREAGAEWRVAGCSMCIAMNGDQHLPHNRSRR